MDRASTARRFLALVVGAVAALAPAPAGAVGQALLRPDMTTMRIAPRNLVVYKDGAKTELGIDNRLANRGTGPLEIRAGAGSSNCDGNVHTDDRRVFQRIYSDANGDGTFERGVDTAAQDHRFGCERYRPHTGIWEIYDLARYDLFRLRSGKRVARSTKVAFCTVDVQRVFPGLPGSPELGYYPTGGCDPTSVLGVSVGWADEYTYVTPGQQLDVTGLGPGRYCLAATGDPDNLLRESDNSNNTHRTKILLRPAKHAVSELPGRCRLGG